MCWVWFKGYVAFISELCGKRCAFFCVCVRETRASQDLWYPKRCPAYMQRPVPVILYHTDLCSIRNEVCSFIPSLAGRCREIQRVSSTATDFRGWIWKEKEVSGSVYDLGLGEITGTEVQILVSFSSKVLVCFSFFFFYKNNSARLESSLNTPWPKSMAHGLTGHLSLALLQSESLTASRLPDPRDISYHFILLMLPVQQR